MKFILKTKVTGVDSLGPGVKLTLEPNSRGEQITFEVDVATTISGNPFATSMNVSDHIFSGAVPNSSNVGDPFSDLSFGATAGRNGDPQFVDRLTSFVSSTKAPAKAVDPFEALNNLSHTREE